MAWPTPRTPLPSTKIPTHFRTLQPRMTTAMRATSRLWRLRTSATTAPPLPAPNSQHAHGRGRGCGRVVGHTVRVSSFASSSASDRDEHADDQHGGGHDDDHQQHHLDHHAQLLTHLGVSKKTPLSDAHSRLTPTASDGAATTTTTNNNNNSNSSSSDGSNTTNASSANQQAFAREFVKPRMDASFLVNNYTAPALAAAYQDREYTLRLCAELLNDGKTEELRDVLQPYAAFSVEQHADTEPPRRTSLRQALSLRHLERIRKRLSRLPRQITTAYTRRAAVVIPLCTFQGEPSVLFTVRSRSVGKHKGEVCFPGGMVDSDDISIEATCLREMNEEVGLSPDVVHVLGILRCDWSSVTSITGIAVTPVVGFVGELRDQSVVINEAEVDSLFTVPLRALADPDQWIRRPNATPVFTGGPHVIWGLTAYLLDICLAEVLLVEPART